MKPKTKCIKLAEIVETITVRAEINQEVADEYAEAMQDASNKFPPIEVFEVDGKYICADGGHRITAAKKNEFLDIVATVRKGTRTDAIKFALVANIAHGLRITNADKHVKVELAFKELPDISNAEIARACAVSHTFVNSMRKDQPETVSGCPRVGADGKVRNSPKSAVQPETVSGSPNTSNSPGTTPPPAKPGAKNPPPPAKPAAKEVATDETGQEILPNMVCTWNQKAEVEEAVAEIDKLKGLVAAAENESHKYPLWKMLSTNTLSVDLNHLRMEMKQGVPFAICYQCGGNPALVNDCGICHGVGFLNKRCWDAVSPEIRELRAKTILAKGGKPYKPDLEKTL